jgi:hypothetical protein
MPDANHDKPVSAEPLDSSASLDYQSATRNARSG